MVFANWFYSRRYLVLVVLRACHKNHCLGLPAISNSPLTVVRENAVTMSLLNDAMDERFRTWTWTNPIPKRSRNPSCSKCARCCAMFFLMNR